jgi:hypothetical protein
MKITSVRALSLTLWCRALIIAGWMSCAAAQVHQEPRNCLVFGILELVGIDEQSACCEVVAAAAPAVIGGAMVDPALVVQLCAETGCKDAVVVAVAGIGISQQQISASGVTCSEGIISCKAMGGNMAPSGSQSSCDGVYNMHAACNFTCGDGMYPTGRHQCLASGRLAGGACSPFESIIALQTIVDSDLNWTEVLQMVNLERVDGPGVLGWSPDNICASVPKLNTIAVVGSKISGTISPSLWECELLRYLDISNTLISGTIPMPPHGSPLPLHTLKASGTSLSGTLPSLSSVQAPQFERLNINVAHISGTLPMALPSTIRDYSVSHNRIGGTVSDLASLRWLGRINLAHNMGISGTVPRLSTALVVLDFENNAVSGSLPADAHTLRRLQVLSLGVNQISSTIPASYSNLNPGTKLWLNSNHIFGLIPSKMREVIGLYANLDGQHLCPFSSGANAGEYACYCKPR